MPTKNKKLTLSIVIPVFNEEGYLGVCLEAIARQTTAPDEVIIVDNNSSDKTAGVASAFNFVKVIKEKKQGVVFARSTGFDAARSHIIARIDGDTILPPNWVRQTKAIYRAAGAPAFYAATAPSRFRNRFAVFWYTMHRLTYFWPSRLLLGHVTLVGSNMFITRKLWQAVRADVCLRINLHEDMDLAFHISKNGTPINFLPSHKASIVARKMVSRAASYPLMMWRVRNNPSHLS